MVKSIVTGNFGRTICDAYGIKVYETLTGFKNICGAIPRMKEEGYSYFFGYEESIGCAPSEMVRDKDGISTSLLICEMAAWYRTRGMTLLDGLQELHKKYGEYDDYTVNLVRKGVEGTREIADMMEYLRHTPPESIDGLRVTERKDYLSGENTHIKGSNVLEYRLEGGSRLSVRPSGTEPKIKIYALTINHSPEALAQAMAKRLTDR
jgi:phosphoglucomutase